MSEDHDRPLTIDQSGPRSLAPRLFELSRRVEDVLVAQHQLTHWLKPDHPPFTSTLAVGMQHYGGPGAQYDLWAMCRAVHHLDRCFSTPLIPAEPSP